ncbi:hypothetical protein MAR_029999, partial [Mya arenaria]
MLRDYHYHCGVRRCQSASCIPPNTTMLSEALMLTQYGTNSSSFHVTSVRPCVTGDCSICSMFRSSISRGRREATTPLSLSRPTTSIFPCPSTAVPRGELRP